MAAGTPVGGSTSIWDDDPGTRFAPLTRKARSCASAADSSGVRLILSRARLLAFAVKSSSTVGTKGACWWMRLAASSTSSARRLSSASARARATAARRPARDVSSDITASPSLARSSRFISLSRLVPPPTPDRRARCAATCCRALSRASVLCLAKHSRVCARGQKSQQFMLSSLAVIGQPCVEQL